MKLQGENFVLRPFERTDAACIARCANNEKIAANLRDVFPHPYTIRDAENFIDYVLSANNDPTTNFVIEINGEAAGGIGISLKTDVYRLNAEVGYWLAEQYWGKGIATSAIKLITTYIFQHFNIVRIYAKPFATNTASARALEKAGYIREAILRKSVFKNGQLLDAFIYSILKN